MQTYLEQLNEVQRKAVVLKDGPVLVIAGAGSGKTRVLTYRIAHLLASGVAPWNILALTFTNKAATEMKDRIGKLVGDDLARSLWMGTFHSIFGKMLRIESELLGFPSEFSIYDTADSKSLVKSIIKEFKLDDSVYKPNGVLARISNAKNNLITAAAYKGNNIALEEDRHTKRPEIARIYNAYSNRCKQSSAMDFDDLLLYTNILFKNFPEVLGKYQQKFKYILVDEYQDTNFSQYLIVKKLAQLHNNICVVGDDAQSIYSFRGAKIENILNFKNDYPQYKHFKLEQNYRSTKTIVKAADSLIKQNENQIPKDIFSENDDGELIEILDAHTDNEEGYLVINDLFEQIANKQMNYCDFAILYRTNAQSRIFEEALRKRNIPYKIYGGLSFYQRKEVKDLIAYFRIVINTNDSEALKRIINYPARGIGGTTLSKIEAAANSLETSMWEVIEKAEKVTHLNINKGTLTKLKSFHALISSFAANKDKYDAYDLARTIATETGLLKDLHNGKTIEDRTKYENVEELLNGIRDFVSAKHNNEESAKLAYFLENIALLTNQDNETIDDKNKVTLMTIHSAKGLEFPQVYVVGMEEDLFPSKMSVHSKNELEEERRLFYVALTRAENRVTLSYSKSRYKYGSPSSTSPSRFLNEIDKEFIKSKPLFKSSNNYGFSSSNQTETIFSQEKKTFKKPSIAAKNLAANRKRNNTNSNFKADNPNDINSGMNIRHEQFGIGKVIQIEGEGQNRKAIIFFQKFGEKKLLLRFARLRIETTNM